MPWVAFGAALLLCGAALAAALVLHALRRRPASARRRILRPLHPVVLAHGFLGFDEIALAGKRHLYFRGVASRLEQMGAEVHTARLPPLASVAARAEKLAELVRALPAPKVNIVAHSMGGLDARYAIARLGLDSRVASLITVGTPHRGTPVADLGAGLIGPLARLVERSVGLSAFSDLTTAHMATFNREVPNVRHVAYASVVGQSARRRTHPLLWPTHLYLKERAGPNDGLVPAASQPWGEVLREVEADHWAQVGWSRGFDAAELYADILRELSGRGF